MNIQIIPAYEHKEDIKLLFDEYTKILTAGDSKFIEYLSVQNYDEELNNLDVKYGTPFGRLYIMYCDGNLAGCIGLRKIDEVSCEMKRLYVRNKFRGNRLGEHLIKKIIVDAKDIGYSFMYLDTLPFLHSALHIYKKFGFYEIPCYNNSPMENSIYMKLDL